MAQNKKKPSPSYLAMLTRALCLAVFLCASPYSASANIADTDGSVQQAEQSPSIVRGDGEKTGFDYETPAYVALSCDASGGTIAVLGASSQNAADVVLSQTDQAQTPPGQTDQPGPADEKATAAKTISELAHIPMDAAQIPSAELMPERNAFFQLPLLYEAALTPDDCEYSAELEERIIDMAAATAPPVVTTKDLHAHVPSLTNSRPFPIEEIVPPSARPLERFFAKHAPPMPISVALASCHATKLAKLPAMRTPWTAPIATIAPIEKVFVAEPVKESTPAQTPVAAKAEPTKKPFEMPFVSEVLSSCAYAKFVTLPIARTPQLVPMASIAPAETKAIVKAEPTNKPFEMPFVSEVLSSCAFAEFAELPIARTPQHKPMASIAPVPPDKPADKTYVAKALPKTEPIVAQLPKVETAPVKPQIASPMTEKTPEQRPIVVKTVPPKPEALEAKITPIDPETIESKPGQRRTEERTAVAKAETLTPKAEEQSPQAARPPLSVKADSRPIKTEPTAEPEAKQGMMTAKTAPATPAVPQMKLQTIQAPATLKYQETLPVKEKTVASAPKTIDAPNVAPQADRIVVAKLAPTEKTPMIDTRRPGSPDLLPAMQMPPDYSPPDITRGGTDEKRVAFTFDGGAEDADAAIILDTLKERGIKTTVFLTGEFIQKYPDVVRSIVAQGHEVGNHTMTHPHLTTFETNRRHKTIHGVTKATLRTELRDAAAAFKAVTGVEMAPLWRAPYGEVNEEIRKWAYDEGYMHIGWTTDRKAKQSLDTLDWVADKKSRLYRTAGEIKKRLLSFGQNSGGVNGGIVLMHLGTQRIADRASEMLGEVMDELSLQGYKIVNVSSLIRGHTALEAIYRLRKDRVLQGVVMADERVPSTNGKLP